MHSSCSAILGLAACVNSYPCKQGCQLFWSGDCLAGWCGHHERSLSGLPQSVSWRNWCCMHSLESCAYMSEVCALIPLTVHMWCCHSPGSTVEPRIRVQTMYHYVTAPSSYSIYIALHVMQNARISDRVACICRPCHSLCTYLLEAAFVPDSLEVHTHVC